MQEIAVRTDADQREAEDGGTPPAIALARTTDAESWDRFVLASAAGSFYHRFAWSRILHESLGVEPVYLMARRDDQVVGVLPLVLVSSRLFGQILCSMPFLNFGGPCAASEAVTRALIDEAVRVADERGVDYLELRSALPLPTRLEASLHKVSMTIGLQDDPEILWNGFRTKHRTNVRRAMKNGLVAHSGGAELLHDFYGVLEQSWRDLGTPLYRRDFFGAILAAFPAETRIHLCRHGDQTVAVAFNGMQRGVIEGMWAGGLPAARHLNANYVLYWHMIEEGCRGGFRQFHLGRSTVDSGGEWFKTRWNAEARQLHWYFHRPRGGPMPALNVDNPKYRAAIAVWRRLPLWVVRRAGPLIARSIP